MLLGSCGFLTKFYCLYNIAIIINTIITHLYFPHFSDETVFISQKQLLIFMFKVSE